MSEIATLMPFITFDTSAGLFNLTTDYNKKIYNFKLYKSESILLGEIKSSADQKKKANQFSLTVPLDSPSGSAFSNAENITGSVTVRLVVLDSDENPVGQPVFSITGQLATVTSSKQDVTLTCSAINEELKSEIFSRQYSNLCHYTVYDSQCALVAHEDTLSVLQVFNSGFANMSVIRIPLSDYNSVGLSYPEERKKAFKHGVVTYLHPDTGEYRTCDIKRIDGQYICVVPDIPTNISSVTIKKGCGLTFRQCLLAHDNVYNFGGFPYMTGGENPFKDTVLD